MVHTLCVPTHGPMAEPVDCAKECSERGREMSSGSEGGGRGKWEDGETETVRCGMVREEEAPNFRMVVGEGGSGVNEGGIDDMIRRRIERRAVEGDVLDEGGVKLGSTRN